MCFLIRIVFSVVLINSLSLSPSWQALSTAGSAIKEAAMKDGKPGFGDPVSPWVVNK